MNKVSWFHYLLALIICCNELLFLIFLNSLITDSLHFPFIFTHGFIPLLFNVINRIKIIIRVWHGLLLHEYDSIIKDYLKSNTIEEVNGNEVVTSAHYLPHHAVIRSNRETTKPRIVFGASAKSDNNKPSLNDILYIGPCLLLLIEDILLRFRLGRIAVVADMQQAFLQISVSECHRHGHRNYLRFLWYNNIFDENSWQVSRFGRLLFGLTCSPFLLNCAVTVPVENMLIMKLGRF